MIINKWQMSQRFHIYSWGLRSNENLHHHTCYLRKLDMLIASNQRNRLHAQHVIDTYVDIIKLLSDVAVSWRVQVAKNLYLVFSVYFYNLANAISRYCVRYSQSSMSARRVANQINAPLTNYALINTRPTSRSLSALRGEGALFRNSRRHRQHIRIS